MAYTDEQKRQHILELQAYLHGISHQSQLPHLIPDGVYGENTANAVRLFQQQNQLPPTGETDTATWNAIAQAYRQEVRPTVLHLRLFPTGITAYAPGDKGSAVFVIQGGSTGDPQCVSCRSAGTEQRRLRHCHKKCGAAVPGADAFAAQRHSRRRHLEPPACGTAPIKKDSFSCLTL